MATRRERLENKLEKRREWAGKATFRAAESFGAARRLGARIPFGQPILVGHHSERHARRDAERITRGMQKGCELSNLAAHHTGAARGLERQLESSVFSDDPDAVEALEAKIEKAEAYQAKCKAVNAAIRKHAKAGREAQQTALEELGFSPAQAVEALTPDFAGRLGVPDYVSKNNGANIRRLRKRLEEVRARQARTARAEATPDGVLVEGTGDYIRVTFPDKPAREVLDALRAAGFRWGGGSWTGRRAALPVELGLRHAQERHEVFEALCPTQMQNDEEGKMQDPHERFLPFVFKDGHVENIKVNSAAAYCVRLKHAGSAPPIGEEIDPVTKRPPTSLFKSRWFQINSGDPSAVEIQQMFVEEGTPDDLATAAFEELQRLVLLGKQR